ncbi:GNAT family N-acetyltransferase [Robiginitalea sp. M366]|uniref:GNAT family N-acetyltransferase n=1 Tax=Robiginitalea aestuariiviva TaxID=3036903 RepID=UPI00240D4D20|nr:GNAT family N-acetyltransferase [Robiginitalea aestuariiviva]MDG1571205.1 GNAT family N-acetyltransferase [Robiginitalea aestuariiviva]
MNYTIRPAREADMPAVHRLITELAIYEKEPDAVEVTVEQLREDGFGPNPKFQCFVADSGMGVDGMALVYPRYSTWKGPALHLEDLIVTEPARGSGIGSALLTEVIRHAQHTGAGRVSWEVLDWNEPAIRFYKSRGARILRDWDVVQLDREGIDQYLKTYAGI